ncbi:MAG: flippase [Oscillospiraceae bacterium]|nr:flippase [Oscillospiraceae bacterium]
MNSVGEKLNILRSNRVVSNAKWMIAEQAVQMIVSFVIGMITARYLGPANYGVINYCYAYIAFFTAVAGLGIEAIVVKELIACPEKEGEIIGSSIILRLFAGMLSVVSILLILFFVDSGNELILRVGFLQSIVLVFKAFEIIDYWFQSKLQSKYASILKSISYVLVAFYKVYILVSAKSVEWFAFSTSLDFLIIAVLLVWAYFRHSGSKWKFSVSISKLLLRQGYHFIISNLIITVYAQIDKVMIKHMIGEADTGLYSAALMICTYWVLVPTAIINSMRPIIMELKKDGKESEYKRKFSQLYSILIWLGIVVSLVISVLSPFIMKVVYGEKYVLASGALSIAIWYTTFSTLGVARGNWLVCENKNKYAKWFVFFGAVVNIILNLILIPIMGIEGAAVATLITQIVVCFVGPVVFKDTRENAVQMLKAFVLK